MRVVVSQEVFDGVVRDNMEVFDMSEEEAIKGAIEEYKLQGADLSGVITKPGAGLLVQQHPLIKIFQDLSSLNEQENAQNVEQIMENLEKVKIEVEKIMDKEEFSLLTGISEKCDLLHTLKIYLNVKSNIVNLKAAKILSKVVQIKQLKKKFEKQDGTKTVKNLLFSEKNNNISKEFINLAENLCINSEDSKAVFLDDEGAETIAEQFQSTNLKFEYCNFIISLISADDLSSPSSGVFKHARSLAKQNLYMHALQLLQKQQNNDDCNNNNNNTGNNNNDGNNNGISLQISLIQMLRKLCVNDEICKLVGQNNGVKIIKQILEDNIQNFELVIAGIGFVRQLVNSDDLKNKISNEGFLEIIQKLITVENEKILENCCAILSALMLRNPEMGQKIFSDGFGEVFANLLNNFVDNANVMRQVCQAIRNMVVRNDDLKEKMLKMGVEKQLQLVKINHKNCQDVAMAALRDLGVDIYGE